MAAARVGLDRPQALAKRGTGRFQILFVRNGLRLDGFGRDQARPIACRVHVLRLASVSPVGERAVRQRRRSDAEIV